MTPRVARASHMTTESSTSPTDRGPEHLPAGVAYPGPMRIDGGG